MSVGFFACVFSLRVRKLKSGKWRCDIDNNNNKQLSVAANFRSDTAFQCHPAARELRC